MQMLKQIQDRAGEITGIITDLLDFAQPKTPQPTNVSPATLIDDAIRQTAEKQNRKQLEIETQNISDLKEVFVDYQQITSAVVNILSNALQSYPESLGPVKIVGDYDEATDSVKLQIIDTGCGMDASTLQKATQPFFSAKPAGRRGGMGLAHTKRLLQLNKGSLHIKSRPQKGTTVTILLPCKQ